MSNAATAAKSSARTLLVSVNGSTSVVNHYRSASAAAKALMACMRQNRGSPATFFVVEGKLVSSISVVAR